jgi:hypothetical protein
MTNIEAKAEIARLASVPVAPDYFVAIDGEFAAAPTSGWVASYNPEAACATEAEAERRAARQGGCVVIRRSPAEGRATRVARLEALAAA